MAMAARAAMAAKLAYDKDQRRRRQALQSKDAKLFGEMTYTHNYETMKQTRPPTQPRGCE